jgi:hypothetical protein
MLAEFLYKSAGDELFLEHLEGDLGCLSGEMGRGEMQDAMRLQNAMEDCPAIQEARKT